MPLTACEEDAEEDGHALFKTLPAPLSQTQECRRYSKKNLGNLDVDHEVIGFLDETSPQTTSNTVRMWSFSKPIKYKKTDNYKANAFGFYSINGRSTIDFMDQSKQ